VAGQEYELDCIIYASGFEVGTDQTSRNGFDVTGSDGLKLSESWSDGMRSLHGIHVHGFPNMFIVGGFQGAALLSNVPHNFTESGLTIDMMIRHAGDKGFKEIEVTQKAEDDWLKLLGRGNSGQRAMQARMLKKCTPGYYNNEGQQGGLASQAMGYPRGAVAFFKYLKKWRNSGKFKGLEFR